MGTPYKATPNKAIFGPFSQKLAVSHLDYPLYDLDEQSQVYQVHHYFYLSVVKVKLVYRKIILQRAL